LAGAAVGWVQFKLLWRIVEGRKPWLLAIKLPLWAAGMIASVAVSVAALIGFTLAASVSFTAFGYAFWRAKRKGA
jgi:hypothetical protein